MILIKLLLGKDQAIYGFENSRQSYSKYRSESFLNYLHTILQKFFCDILESIDYEQRRGSSSIFLLFDFPALFGFPGNYSFLCKTQLFCMCVFSVRRFFINWLTLNLVAEIFRPIALKNIANICNWFTGRMFTAEILQSLFINIYTK